MTTFDPDLWPEPERNHTVPDPVCIGCNRRPAQIGIYAQMAELASITADAYVRREEGTYNRASGHFLCDTCYIVAGMPSGPRGWVAP